ncbi:MAG TPA: hydantoinase/oxoprolinase family protein [Candidatus Acidoferrum sp.]|nr:hydantoinase/oxoprolinase family protein [Candidatus Acidoferrum sp.]
MRIATDTGGTFTDCVFVRDGKLEILKVPSQPRQPAASIASALAEVGARSNGETPAEIDLVCGTTVGTNALLERRGGRIMLITTAGFEDVLEIGRQARPKLYDLFFQKTDVLVPGSGRVGARERVAADGRIVAALTSGEIRRLARKVQQTRPDAVAICFLFSFRNPRHETALAKALRRAGCLVSVSHEILAEFREFERTSTTVVNAYLAPVMTSYLREAEARARSAWRQKRSKPKVSVRVMQSNGGVIAAQRAADEPVRTVLSGPAGGVLGAAYAARLAGLDQVLTFDMGGTSTDVALLSGETQITTEARVAGLPVAVPMLEIHTVGAGGGSIARFDRGGALRVGPESAGADPGPVCYGRGEQPTVTDAHAVLGHFGDRGLLNGAFPLDIARAQDELNKRKGRCASVEAFAQGIIGVSNSVMERALRLVSIERGHDPRDYTLVAFGGAGGLHACDLAEALDLRGVLLPVFPGALSALGILRANVVRDFSRTVLLRVAQSAEALDEARRYLVQMRRSAQGFLRNQGFAPAQQRFDDRLDVRYVGQAYELSVAATPRFVDDFHRGHEQAYGHAETQRSVEIVNVRCRAVGRSPEIALPRIAKARAGAAPPARTWTVSYWSGKNREVPLYDRQTLRAGHTFSGPAIVAEYSATSLVPDGWRARVDAYGQIHLAMSGKSARRHGR